jgi:fatty-acyl-CoA synthase
MPRRVPRVSDNVASWLVRHAEQRGEKLALTDEERRLDYRALEERTERCAAVFAARGIGRGDRVALLLGNRSAYLEAVFAAARLAAIAVPINARLTPREIRQLLADCTPRLLLHEETLGATIEGACQGLPEPPAARLSCGGAPDAYESALAAADPRGALEPVSPGDPMMLMYTSGTTGMPKGALLPHRKTLYNSRNAELFFELSAEDRVLVMLPLFHSFGLKILSIPTLYAGGTVHLQRRFDPQRVWETVGRERISFFGGVPSMFRALLDALETAPPGRFDLASLRFLFSAGAAIPVEIIHAFETRGLVLKQGFGQTLCCLDAKDAVRKAGSVGRPVRHAEVRVVAQSTVELAPEGWRDAALGETGEIVVRGPITMLGYWLRPEETAEVRRGEWLRTGDLATVDDEGFLTLVGRARHMYISGGENVYPAEIEAVYEEHPSIQEIAVVGVPDPKWGEVGHAYCLMVPGTELDPEALLAWGAERLADFKLPKRFLSVTELPRTATGKVQKDQLAISSRRRLPTRSAKSAIRATQLIRSYQKTVPTPSSPSIAKSLRCSRSQSSSVSLSIRDSSVIISSTRTTSRPAKPVCSSSSSSSMMRCASSQAAMTRRTRSSSPSASSSGTTIERWSARPAMSWATSAMESW